MIGIQRRKRVEGWAQEVSEAEANGAPSTLRQKIGEDNRLWLIAAGLIVIVGFWLIMNGQPQQSMRVTGGKSMTACNGSYDDEKHQNFTTWIMGNKRFSNVVLEAGFVGPGNFRLVMPNNCSPDDIQHTAKMIAWHIEDKLRERPVVNVYLRKPSGSGEHKAGAVAWNSERATYVLKMAGQTEEVL